MEAGKKKIEIVLPCYNEEKLLSKNFLGVFAFLIKSPYNWTITIAENGSTDKTKMIAKELSQNYNKTNLLISAKGRGRAIKAAWAESDADILVYMDVDLSVKPEEIPKLINALDDADIAIGSRLLEKSRCKRSLFRTFVSKSCNRIIKLFFKTDFSDAQCGFKGIKKNIKYILNEVENEEWFFDTELLVRASKKGLRIKEVPISWNERNTIYRKSKVKLFKDSFNFLTEILRLRKELKQKKK